MIPRSLLIALTAASLIVGAGARAGTVGEDRKSVV